MVAVGRMVGRDKFLQRLFACIERDIGCRRDDGEAGVDVWLGGAESEDFVGCGGHNGVGDWVAGWDVAGIDGENEVGD